MRTANLCRPQQLHRRRLLAASALFALGAPGLRARADGAAEPALGGTGTGLAPLRLLIAAARLPARVVPNLGSGGGLKALAAGALDVAVSARRLNDAERAAGLVEHEAFRTPFVWAVHPSVPLTQATVRDLTGWYAGNEMHWRDGQKVRLVLRPDADTDTLMVKAIDPELSNALAAAARRPGMRVAVTDDDAVTDIERIAGALGVTSLSLVAAQQRNVRVLALDGVSPSVMALRAGRYMHAKSLYLVTRAAPSPAAVALLRAVATREGSELLAHNGCLPMAGA